VENVRKYCYVQWIVHGGKYTSSSGGSRSSIYSVIIFLERSVYPKWCKRDQITL
jgi:hypothetical protein